MLKDILSMHLGMCYQMEASESTIYAILEEIVRLGRSMLRNKTAPLGQDVNFIKNLHDYAKLLG